MLDIVALLCVWLLAVTSGLWIWRRAVGHAGSRLGLLLRAAALSAVLGAAIVYGSWGLMKSQTFQVVGPLISRAETSESLVAMTLDDGPGEGGAEILSMLGELGIRATFFVQGSSALEHIDTVRALASAGHELGNHTFSHRRMVFRSREFISAEVERTDFVIRQAGYTGTIRFRPPYGKKLLALPLYLARTGREAVMADVQPDTHFTDVPSMVAYALERTRPGSIVLLHPWFRPASRAALPVIVRGLHDRGYRFVTVSELLERHSAARP